VLRQIGTQVAEQLQRQVTKEQLWLGRRVKSCGFPQLKVFSLFCLQSGALLEVAHDDKLVAAVFRECCCVVDGEFDVNCSGRLRLIVSIPVRVSNGKSLESYPKSSIFAQPWCNYLES
jgi:hypothetical protein